MFSVFRLIGLVGITVTFVVFHVALSHLLGLETWAEAANQLLHTVVPVLAIAGWVAFGPRRLTSARVARLSVLFPVFYMTFTLIRGPLNSDWYPYPFADVKTLGYLKVIINGFWIALLFVALAAGATALDRRLAGFAPQAGRGTLPGALRPYLARTVAAHTTRTIARSGGGRLGYVTS